VAPLKFQSNYLLVKITILTPDELHACDIQNFDILHVDLNGWQKQVVTDTTGVDIKV
jgi:hypothetical protein